MFLFALWILCIPCTPSLWKNSALSHLSVPFLLCSALHCTALHCTALHCCLSALPALPRLGSAPSPDHLFIYFIDLRSKFSFFCCSFLFFFFFEISILASCLEVPHCCAAVPVSCFLLVQFSLYQFDNTPGTQHNNRVFVVTRVSSACTAFIPTYSPHFTKTSLSLS